MKIIAVADLHGHLPTIPACDLLVVGGDLGPATYEYHHDAFVARKWLRGPFSDWLSSAPARHIVGVGGNHDFILQREPTLGASLPWTYLCDSTTTIDGLRIWGSPYTVDFCGWAFMEPDDLLTRRWETIPDDVHLLVTHGPPLGRGDTVPHGDRHVGSSSLAQRMTSLHSLRLHLFGHIHHSSGYRDAVCANVSLCDEAYQPTNPVREFTIKESPDAR